MKKKLKTLFYLLDFKEPSILSNPTLFPNNHIFFGVCLYCFLNIDKTNLDHNSYIDTIDLKFITQKKLSLQINNLFESFEDIENMDMNYEFNNYWLHSFTLEELNDFNKKNFDKSETFYNKKKFKLYIYYILLLKKFFISTL